MIQICNHREECQATWQSEFVKLLPEIERRLRLAFCRLTEEARDDAIEEGIVHSLLTYIRLFEQSRTESVSASNIAWYAAKQVKHGRPAAGHMNGCDVSSAYCQVQRGLSLVSLDQRDETSGEWREVMVEDRHSGPAEVAATRVDFSDWLASLPKRNSRIAAKLAVGETTASVARLFKVTPGRIAQLRREFYANWRAFQGELTTVTL